VREWWHLSEIVTACEGVKAPQSPNEMFCFLVFYCSGRLKSLLPLERVSSEEIDALFKGDMVNAKAIPPIFLDILEVRNGGEPSWSVRGATETTHALLQRENVGERRLFEKSVLSARAEARQCYLYGVGLTRSYPFLSAIPDLRWFSLPWIVHLALPGIPKSQSGIYKWINSAPRDLLHADNVVEWRAFPRSWRTAFSIRWTNAMAALGHLYTDDDFPAQFFTRLAREPMTDSDPSSARMLLIERVRDRMKSGEGKMEAIRATVLEAASADRESDLGKAALAANAKNRGLSERSLRRWIEGADL